MALKILRSKFQEQKDKPMNHWLGIAAVAMWQARCDSCPANFLLLLGRALW
jgi:hypothetical protein